MRILLPVCALLSAIAGRAAAQPSPSQIGTPRLQDATVVARGDTIRITRLPIRTPTGTIYRDVTIELHVDSDGRVTLMTDGAGRAVAGNAAPRRAEVALQAVPSGRAEVSPQTVELPQSPSAPIVMQHFKAGTYALPDGSLVQLEDRGIDLLHHVPMWSLSGSGLLEQATFYSGPPFMNPRSGRLKRGEITSTDYAYGTVDGGGGEAFGSGALIGVAQQGKSLRVVSFRQGCCSDAEAPTAAVTLTYVGG